MAKLTDALKTMLTPVMHIINKKAERPNWNENDPSSNHYIEGRPVYEGEKTAKVFDETLEFVNASDTGAPLGGYIIFGESTFSLNKGQKYKVKYDNAEYELTACEDNVYGYIHIGNGAYLAEENEDNGIPFVIGPLNLPRETISDSIPYFAITSTEGYHKITITTKEKFIQKLNKKFLPSNLGYVSYAESQNLSEEDAEQARANIGAGTSSFSGSYNDLTNKPSIPTATVLYTTQSLSAAQKSQARTNIGAGTSNFSGAYSALSGKPTLSTVATSGSYADLLNKPNVILYDQQTLNTSQRAQARLNIDAVGKNEVADNLSYSSIRRIMKADVTLTLQELGWQATDNDIGKAVRYDSSDNIVMAEPGGPFDGIFMGLINGTEAQFRMRGYGSCRFYVQDITGITEGEQSFVVDSNGLIRLATEEDGDKAVRYRVLAVGNTSGGTPIVDLWI